MTMVFAKGLKCLPVEGEKKALRSAETRRQTLVIDIPVDLS